MSDPSTAAPEDSLADEDTDESSAEPYTLQVMLLRGDPDSDPTEVAGDAWQFDVSDDDEATIAALETLATEYGGTPDAPAPGQEVGPQPAPGPQPSPQGPVPGGQPPQPGPGQQQAPPGGPAAPQPSPQAPA